MLSDRQVLKQILASTPMGDAAKALWPQFQAVASGDLPDDQIKPALNKIMAEFTAKHAAKATV